MWTEVHRLRLSIRSFNRVPSGPRGWPSGVVTGGSGCSSGDGKPRRTRSSTSVVPSPPSSTAVGPDLRQVRWIRPSFPCFDGSGRAPTRAPCRPNAIGLSVVELLRCEGNLLHFDGADILDGTPLLDIKPYTAKFDCIKTMRNGWQDEVDEKTADRKGRRGYIK